MRKQVIYAISIISLSVASRMKKFLFFVVATADEGDKNAQEITH